MITSDFKALIYKYSKSNYILIPTICFVVRVVWGILTCVSGSLVNILNIISFFAKSDLGSFSVFANINTPLMSMILYLPDIFIIIGLIKVYFSARKHPIDSFDCDGFDMIRCAIFYKGFIFSIELFSTTMNIVKMLAWFDNTLNYISVVIIIIAMIIEIVYVYFMKKVYDIPLAMSFIDEQNSNVIEISTFVIIVCVIEGVFTCLGAIISMDFVEVAAALTMLIFGIGLKKIKNEVQQISK